MNSIYKGRNRKKARTQESLISKGSSVLICQNSKDNLRNANLSTLQTGEPDPKEEKKTEKNFAPHPGPN